MAVVEYLPTEEVGDDQHIDQRTAKSDPDYHGMKGHRANDWFCLAVVREICRTLLIPLDQIGEHGERCLCV